MRAQPLILALTALAAPALAGCSDDPQEFEPTATPPISALSEPVPWDNATVYFVITDRFYDGDPSNNSSYGRALDGGDEVGTFHGGDLAGLTAKLEEGYFSRLGVSALWITAPYEQIHGWVPGGSGDFKHYPYHGYYARDFTRIDANMGTPDDFTTFVAAAHSRGIRVVLDVVMNHPGYAAIQDLAELGVDVLNDGWEGADLGSYYGYIRFQDESFADWWGPDWIRAGLGGGYEPAGSTNQTMSVGYLPDFKTEAAGAVELPPIFAHMPGTGATALPDATVRDYLVTWLTTWVGDYGVDGFRCDTAKHVELEAWAELKDAANQALSQWRAAHPALALPDSAYVDPAAPFWMTGEVFPHGVVKDEYYDNGFDSLLNFDYPAEARGALSSYGAIDATWSAYAGAINGDPDFNALSYLSSHDTALFFASAALEDLEKQKRAGALLLLAPGAVQIFYGDENARPMGPSASDALQGTRSDYQWGENPEVLAHWRRIGQFRRRHVAVGAGSHERMAQDPYTFRRVKGDDVVYVALGAGAEVSIAVADHFADGALLRDAYSGRTAEVEGGQVTFPGGDEGVVLVESAE